MDIDQLFDEFIEFPEGSNGKYVTTVSTKLFAKYCVEKLQEENERLLFSNRYNADMYRQIDDERKRLQAEVERLREGDKQTDFTIMNLLIEKKIQIEKLEKERDQLKALLQDVNTTDYRFSVEQLAAHDAEVIEQLKKKLLEFAKKSHRHRGPGIEFAVDLMDDCIDQLRQQAKE